MTRKPRIVIETFPNELSRDYHVNTRITNTKYLEDFDRPQSRHLQESMGLEPLNEKEQSFVNDLHSIDGVTVIGIDTYTVHVTIGAAFDWDNDVELEVIARIKQYLGWTDQKVNIHNRRIVTGRPFPYIDSDEGSDEEELD